VRRLIVMEQWTKDEMAMFDAKDRSTISFIGIFDKQAFERANPNCDYIHLVDWIVRLV